MVRSVQRTARPEIAREWVAVLVLLAVGNLIGAIAGGLARLGALPSQAAGPTGPASLAAHGAVLMAGFFGTVIALERVVALRRGWWVPALAALSGWAAWIGGWWSVAQIGWIGAAAGLLGLYGWAAKTRAASLPLAVEASGAAALLLGNAAWAWGDIETARFGWSAFLVLTIAGERCELARLVRLPPWASVVFIAVWVALGAAPALTWWHPDMAAALWWTSLAALALWLLRFDVATRQWRASGWAGHTALCLLTGYGWLAGAALLGWSGSPVAWHVLWVGFVLAMVFGHAPILMPALAGWHPQPTRWGLLPLGVLGASVLLRVVATIGGHHDLLAAAGLGHAVAILLFGAVMVRAVRRGLKRR